MATVQASIHGNQLSMGLNSGTLGGTAMQLSIKSLMNSALTHDPSTSWWRRRILAYVNFAMDTTKLTFGSGTRVGFGSNVTANITISADLLYFMYLIMRVPGIRACSNTSNACGGVVASAFPSPLDPTNGCTTADAEAIREGGGEGAFYRTQLHSSQPVGGYQGSACAPERGPYAYWSNGIGQIIPKEASFAIGGGQVADVFAASNFMWEELSGRPGARLGELVGKATCFEDLLEFSSRTRLLYVPLPFWFTLSPGAALVTAALTSSFVTLTLQTEQLANCVVQSSPNVSVVKVENGQLLNQDDLDIVLEVTQVQVSDTESQRYETEWFSALTTNVVPYNATITGREVNIEMDPNGPVIEMMWAARRRCREQANNWFNFTGVRGEDPLVSVALTVGGQERFARREAPYFRNIQPLQFHTNIPDAALYNYSFSLYPEQFQPSGAAPLGRVNNTQLSLELAESLATEQMTILVFLRTYNLLAYEKGNARLTFARR